jgi:hypothetical protein
VLCSWRPVGWASPFGDRARCSSAAKHRESRPAYRRAREWPSRDVQVRLFSTDRVQTSSTRYPSAPVHGSIARKEVHRLAARRLRAKAPQSHRRPLGPGLSRYCRRAPCRSPAPIKRRAETCTSLTRIRLTWAYRAPVAARHTTIRYRSPSNPCS